jgi:membrane protease YdiL (CAAX protease family)
MLPIERVGAALEVVLCSGFPTQLLIVGVLTVLGMRVQTSSGGISPRFLFTVSLCDAALVIGLIVVLLRSHGESIRDVLVGRGPVIKEVLFGFALIPVVFMVVVGVLALVLTFAPTLHNVLKNPLEGMLTTRLDAAIFAVVVMVAGGVREEMQRGFIVHRFEGYLGGGLAGVVLYAVVFGLGHFEQGWDASLATGSLGLFWGLVFLRRRSIVAPVVSHAGFNLAQVVKAVALR